MAKATHSERAQVQDQRRRSNGREPEARDEHDMMDAPIESYVTLMREIDHIQRVWVGSMRQSIAAGFSLAYQLSQAMIGDTKWLSDRWLNLYDRDRQVLSAFGRDMAGQAERMGSQMERQHLQAAEHRQAAE